MLDISDHLPNFLIINKLSILSSKIKIFKRDYSKLDELTLIEDVQSIDWQQILPNSKNVDDTFDAFHTSINEVINKHIPIGQLSRKEIKSLAKPWITPAIKIFINIKNKLFANYLKTKSVLTHLKYKRYRKNHLLNISKMMYNQNYFSENMTSTKNIWKGINQIITLKPQSLNFPNKIQVDNAQISNPNDIAKEFNNFFANISSKLASSINSSSYRSYLIFTTT